MGQAALGERTGGIALAADAYFKGRGGLLGDLPFIEEFNICQGLGWSWQEVESVPAIVRQIFLVYLRMQARAVKPE